VFQSIEQIDDNEICILVCPYNFKELITMSFSFLSSPRKLHLSKNESAEASTSPVTPKDKREYFKKVLAEEFKREILYAHAVDLKRAPARDPFITQVTNRIKDLISVIPSGTIGKVLNASGTAASSLAEKKRDEKLALIANLVNKLDLARLDILLESVARSAACRYQLFIDQLSDNENKGVVPFARIGARRILEYVSRQDEAIVKKNNGLLLTEDIMLTGLIEGRSGSGTTDGFFNFKLELKSSDESKSLKTISAECIYGRPGFQVFEIKDNVIEEKLYTRDITSLTEKAKKTNWKFTTIFQKAYKRKRI